MENKLGTCRMLGVDLNENNYPPNGIGIGMDSWYIHGLMVKTWGHDIDMESWY